MGADATAARTKQHPPLPMPLPPALRLARARLRATTKVAGLDDDDAAPATPPLRPPVTVPFLWEEAPGKPKPRGGTAAAIVTPTAAASPVAHAGGSGATDDGVDQDEGDDAEARAVPPLKLPPRLQVQATSAAENPASPRTVLHGPYGCAGGARRALRRTGSVAAFRRTPSAGGGLFSWRKASAVALGSSRGGHDSLDAGALPLDASCCSPAASSASSSSSLSCFADDRGHGHGAVYCRPAEDSEEDDGAKGSVRITRFTRNKSLPSMTTAHVWRKHPQERQADYTMELDHAWPRLDTNATVNLEP
ncbi:hypothetical protein ACP70R_046625 [Stipagrostis hirtigluma subsp. patula]